jgi:hypothetical protein
VKHFQAIYIELERIMIKKILYLTSYFTSFVSKENNEMLMEEVFEEDLKTIMNSFQKDKSLCLDGWIV